ncbi:glutathione S-transferase family protein [Caldimonas brevitalea]|uniref:Glutathione S-transferase n=1 Tax=Caldimonas brevitalea TaxID=413882 RepID=A0A0G3BL39_9BURK|nr:glutathione S-transferase family protein [Caldimonas brevitalea]AKJ27255.1 glutathione S-transferase [Caldimonas brevitalea]
MQLYIGNKNYSSWSLRPWLLLTHAGIPFEEVKLRLSVQPESAFKQTLARVSPVGKVPVLVEDDGYAIWDSLAICEYVAERFPERQLWPADVRLRARARSICAEMHNGFGALREHLPMNVELRMPEIGAKVLATQPDVARDLARLVQMWSELLDTHGGPFLFGRFSVADAYFAPICSRLHSYAVEVPPRIATYVEHILGLPAMQAWTEAALAEADFIDFDEPYRQSRG